MLMKGTYPTIEEVLCADLDELTLWDSSLRPPQADAEHAAFRRIKKRLVELRAERRPLPGNFDDFCKAFDQIFGSDARRQL